jgi:hypothetical protein
MHLPNCTRRLTYGDSSTEIEQGSTRLSEDVQEALPTEATASSRQIWVEDEEYLEKSISLVAGWDQDKLG